MVLVVVGAVVVVALRLDCSGSGTVALRFDVEELGYNGEVHVRFEVVVVVVGGDVLVTGKRGVVLTELVLIPLICESGCMLLIIRRPGCLCHWRCSRRYQDRPLQCYGLSLHQVARQAPPRSSGCLQQVHAQ